MAKLKNEVRRIFNDLESWLNYCRFNMIEYNEAHLYKSPQYKAWQERRRKRQVRRQEQQAEQAKRRQK